MELARYRRARPAARAARAGARALAVRWGHPDLADDVELLVSEVFSNAVIHGTTGRGSQVHVTYRLLDDRIHVEVRDAATGRPGLMPPVLADEEVRENGRGLLVVSRVAHRWGVVRRVIGKSVWFEILLRGEAARGASPEEPS